MRSLSLLLFVVGVFAFTPSNASAGMRICGSTTGVPGMVSVSFNAQPVPSHLTPKSSDFRRGINAYVHPTARRPDVAVKIGGVYYVLTGGQHFYQHLAGRKVQIKWRKC